MSDSTKLPVIIAGTGIAGYTVARELRKLNPSVPIVMVSADDGCFYSKPTLSNALAAKKAPRELVTYDAAAMSSQLNATIIAHRIIDRIDPDRHEILVDGAPLRYSSLVLALGADAKRLPLAGDAADAVLSVNDLTDYAKFRNQLEGARSIVVLGAGLIGCEFANDLSIAGFTVTLVDPASTPLSRLLPDTAGEALALALSNHGIKLRLQQSVSAVNKTDTGLRVSFPDGDRVDADVVLSAIGLAPRTAIAAKAGLKIDGGILTDRWCRTSAVDIFALGDCAAIEGKVQPYVLPIMHAARALARTLNGEETSVTFPVMPVTVKVPAMPAVVAAPELAGIWRYPATATPGELRALCEDEDNGRPLGFALLGTATQSKALLLKAMSEGRF
ncbi:FAD-dependent oxidoreductase [Burkholderia vietnamiensis]|uniref:NAD(P)/FAD-dependent oxidoreductase n=1 Tax=Burkholderia vietnamiensis TaxID=60552 RepID=UPI002653EBC8|nr:FAD-dependent oxidoreductase [Burkholderia vietnamiensis]MDN7408004.1 FAD-dependent oxidoreductase [Burkholderia vietnamiensis]